MGPQSNPKTASADTANLALQTSFRHVLAELSRLTDSQQEEALTSMLLGSWAVVTPVFVRLLGSGTDVSHRCAWGMYKKQESADRAPPESEVGADFALLIYRPDGKANLGLFQAKKSLTKSQCSIPVNPKQKRGRSQAVSLVASAQLARQVARGETTASIESTRTVVVSAVEKASAGKTVDDIFPELDFAYYVAYLTEAWSCVAVRDVGLAFLGHAPEGETARTSMVLDDVSSFATLLEHGFSDGNGWLVCDPDELKAILPLLVDLMPACIYAHPFTGFPKIRIRRSVYGLQAAPVNP